MSPYLIWQKKVGTGTVPVVFAYDTFTGTSDLYNNHTGDRNTNWTIHPESFVTNVGDGFHGIQSNRFCGFNYYGLYTSPVPSNSHEMFALTTVAPPSANYQVDFEMFETSLADGESYYLGSLLRFDPTQRVGYVGYYFRTVGNSAIRIRRLDGGEFENDDVRLGTYVFPTVPTTFTPFNLTYKIIGSTISAWYNGTQVLSVTDSTYTAPGRVGMYYAGMEYRWQTGANNFEASVV